MQKNNSYPEKYKNHRRLLSQILKTANEHADPEYFQSEEILTRLANCCYSIPKFFEYAMLQGEYQIAPIDRSRPGRYDAPIDIYIPKLSHTQSNWVSQLQKRGDAYDNAIKFLARPSRLRFILTGQTDLQETFSQEEIQVLNQVQIYVQKDLNRISILEIDKLNEYRPDQKELWKKLQRKEAS